MKMSGRFTLGLALVAGMGLNGALGQGDYTAAIEKSVSSFALRNEFSGVTINLACRRIDAIDFIAKNAAAFEKHTGAKVQFTNFPENELRSKIVADASAKAGGFSLYCLDANYVPLFADNGWVKPIVGIRSAYDLKDLPEGLQGLYSFKNRLYGLPIYSESSMMFYRKDLFAAKGIKVPTTLDELEAAAKALNDPPNVYGIAMRGLRGEGMNVYTWSTWLRSYGGIFLDKTNNAAFNSAEGIEATKRYADIIKNYAPPGSATFGWPEVSSAFKAGRIAMVVDATAFYPGFNNPKESTVIGKIGYAAVPAGPKGKFTTNYSIGIAIPAYLNDTKQYRAALSFLQWATTKEMELGRVNEGIGNQNRNSVSSSDLLKSKLDPEWVKVAAEANAITKAQYRPLIPQWREMGDIIGEEIEKVFTGTATAEVALKSASDRVNALFKEAGLSGKPRQYTEVFPGK